MDARIYDEANLTPTDVTKVLPTRPSCQTVWRWMHKGIAGEKLEWWSVGGAVMTSQEALDRFNQRVTEAKERRRQERSATHPKSTRVARAESTLAKAGF